MTEGETGDIDMPNDRDYQYHTTKSDLEHKLEKAINKTLGEVDTTHVFDIAKKNPKVTGIAGDVIEQSVIGYPANSAQEPDLVVDGEEVELKTTGLRISKKMRGLEAKEPMSITAVSPETIVDEDFEHSNFWHKARHMLLVYYLYDSPNTVPAIEYGNFPIKGYQFHQFSDEERETLGNDWQTVHDFIEDIQDEHPNEDEREALYPLLSSALRDQLLMIDTAPKWPNRPRFRLKRSAVTTMARKNFGEGMEQLPRAYTSYAEVDDLLHRVTEQHRGETLGTMAESYGLRRSAKNISERTVIHMFGSNAHQMSDIEPFARAGIKTKSIVLTKDGRRTEDMKLFAIDFSEFEDPDATFEESPVREWFAEGSLICVVLEEPSPDTPLTDNVFLGFKRISFDDGFIDGEVRRTWDEVHDLVCNHQLRLVPQLDSRGRQLINKTGIPSEAPNFPKSADHVVFVRGTGSDSTRKPECVNGIRMYRQQIWIKGSYLAKRLEGEPWI